MAPLANLGQMSLLTAPIENASALRDAWLPGLRTADRRPQQQDNRGGTKTRFFTQPIHLRTPEEYDEAGPGPTRAERLPMLGKMDCHGQTDVGAVREVNQDQFLIADLNKSMKIHKSSLNMDESRLSDGSKGKLLLVADGMGGHASGERASSLAVDAVVTYILNTMHWFYRLREEREEDFLDELKQALQHCQRKIHEESERSPDSHGMGTTVTLAYLLWPRLYVVHAGDSRCYLYRDDELHQVTRDHTVAQELLERGCLNPQEAEKSHWSHVLWNVVGGPSNELSPEVYKVKLRIGDTILLCSDGLTKHVTNDEIAQHLGDDRSAEKTCQFMIDLANERGGEDNITTIIARFRGIRQQDSAVYTALEAADDEFDLDERDTASWPALKFE